MLDFGLARAKDFAERDASDVKTIELAPVPAQRLLDVRLTAAGTVSGTLPYMPLEQLLGDAADARADQFSFCVALYEALYGVRPFPGETTDELVASIVSNEGVEPPATRGPGASSRRAGLANRVPRYVRKALRRGLGRLPGDRFASMDELIAALRRDAVRAWSRRLAVAAGVLLLVSAAVVGALAIRQRAQLCRGGERHVAGVWDDGAKEATRRAFLSTKLPFAEEAWRLSSTGLDRYATAWTAMHRDACEATQLRGEQSARVLDLRMSCLNSDLEHVRALAQAFAAADEPVVRKAAAAVEGLPPLADCADVRALTGLPQPPKEARSQVEALRAELARASALYDLGRYPDSRAIAERVAATANVVGYRPLHAEALLAQAEAQRRSATDFAATAALLGEAAWAGVASRHDAVALRASSTLVGLIGGNQEDRAGAEPWLRLARAVIERNDSPPMWRAVLADDLGRVAIAAGDFDEAIGELRTALSLRERAGAPATLRADTVMLLGAAMLYSGRAAEGLPHLRQVYELRRKVLGELHPDLASAANNVGAAALVVGDYPTAIEFIRRGLDLKRRILGPDHLELATSLNNLAEALRLAGRFDEAEPLYQEAMTLQRRAYGDEHPNVAEVLDGLGAMENDRGRPDGGARLPPARAGDPREEARALARAARLPADRRGQGAPGARPRARGAAAARAGAAAARQGRRPHRRRRDPLRARPRAGGDPRRSDARASARRGGRRSVRGDRRGLSAPARRDRLLARRARLDAAGAGQELRRAARRVARRALRRRAATSPAARPAARPRPGCAPCCRSCRA